MDTVVSQVFQTFGAAAAVLLVVALAGAKYLDRWVESFVGARVDLRVKERLAQQQHAFDTQLEERKQELALLTGTALERVKRSEERRAEVERVVARFRGPLLQSAFDLQSRMYNIARLGLLRAYLPHGTPEERAYTVDNTLFLVAQYFAWTEIIRREVQLLDIGGEQASRQLSELLDTITHLWRTDAAEYGKAFRVFSGDQRAVGERMVRAGSRGPECMGYAEFGETLAKTPEHIPQLASLRADLLALAAQERHDHPRLIALQHAYVDLLALLDPAYTWYPETRRWKLGDGAVPNATPTPAPPAPSLPS